MKNVMFFLTSCVCLLILFSFSMQQEEKVSTGLVRIKNETKTPKIFSIESVTPNKSKLSLRISLKKDKEYQLETGMYQINYYNVTKAQKHSAYFRLNGNDTVNVVFYKTGKSKYDADIRIE